MNRDDRLYAFVLAQTSRTRTQVRRIAIHKRWLKFSAVCAVALVSAAVYGLFSITQRVKQLSVEFENRRLHNENETQRQQLNELKARVEAIEDKSRRLAEMSGVSQTEADSKKSSDEHGAGGPLVHLSSGAIKQVEERAAQLEQKLHAFENALRLREQARIPSIWPVTGNLTDGFGFRHNPFGGGGSEFHPGQDIATQTGTPVAATADGVVSYADWQNGYGQLVVIDHQNGLFTRYGHLSKIGVAVGQKIKRGDIIGNVGSTGRSTGPHLHYEVRVGDEVVSPLSYLP